MKKLNLISLATILLFLVFGASCNKDESPEPEEQTVKQFNTKSVSAPDAMKQSNEPGAMQSAQYISMMNSMAGYGAMMVPPDKSGTVNLKDGGTDIYTWDYEDGLNNYSATLKITETITYIKWEMIINGVLDNHQLNNFTYLTAEEFKDGSGSTFTMYDFYAPGSVVMTIKWHESGTTTYFTFEIPGEIRITMEVQSDGSGSLDVNDWKNGQYMLSFRAVWDASGHGECWEYDEGTLVDHGVW